MRWNRIAIAVAVGVVAALPSLAADHGDGPAALADPAADVADVFAWTSPDAQKLNLVMTVGRNLATGARFSDRVQYVFHTTSKALFTDPVGFDYAIVCQFDLNQEITCFAGNDGEEAVRGDASAPGGIQRAGGKLRVFAGLRNDPFFFNLAGFRATTAAVTAAAPSLDFDGAGCPALDSATSAFLVGQLRSNASGAAGADAFLGENLLAIVIQIDKALVTRGGPIVGVWGSTNQR